MTHLIFFLVTFSIFLKTASGQHIKTDSLRVDSLFNSINRRPSETELRWVVSQLHEPPLQNKLKDLLSWGTALTAVIGFFLQRRWQLKKDRLERLYNSLQWFEGRTQKRSLGIAMIEANWGEEKSFHRTWISILTNQAVYLLLQSGQEDSAHEIANLRRIMNLLILHKNKCVPEELRQLSYGLQDSFNRGGKPKKLPESEKNTIGLDLSDKNNFAELSEWKKCFPFKNES